MKMVCAMAMVRRRVRFVERLEAIQATMGTLLVHIVGTSGATMETEALCLVVFLIAQSVGQWQMKHNKKGIRCKWTPFLRIESNLPWPREHAHAGNVVQNAVMAYDVRGLDIEAIGCKNYVKYTKFQFFIVS